MAQVEEISLILVICNTRLLGRARKEASKDMRDDANVVYRVHATEDTLYQYILIPTYGGGRQRTFRDVSPLKRSLTDDPNMRAINSLSMLQLCHEGTVLS